MTTRIEPPNVGTEFEVLTGFLDWLRGTILVKTDGLDAEQLRSTHGPSQMTLAGMLKHLAYVEDNWCSVVLEGRDYASPFADVDWAADPDWEWSSALADSPDDLRSLLTGFIEVSRRNVADALAQGGLDHLSARQVGDSPVNLRWILVHLVEEYGRHCGHADLIRESIDGSTGE